MNALCNLSRKKSREVAASLPGRFLSRRCFTLCITMEVEPRIAKQYKCHHCCSRKNYRGKGTEDGGGEKCLCVFFSFFPLFFCLFFFADQKIAKNKLLLIVRETSHCLLPDTFLLRASKMPVGSVNISKFTVTALHCEESTHRK